jgi:sporulation protein YlmC with PRC-barrel domain
MALKIKNLTEVYNMQVFTDAGDYFGDVEEAILLSNKVSGWRIRATRNSFLAKILGGAKGVIVPHRLVKAVGDIFIISKSAVPSYDDNLEDED